MLNCAITVHAKEVKKTSMITGSLGIREGLHLR